MESRRRIALVSFILTTWPVLANCVRPHVQPLIPLAPSASPSSSSDCSQVVYAMSDCVPFMKDGSKTTMPEGSCCSGFKTVVKSGPECVCESIESSVDLGIPLNLTKAMSLASACGIDNAPPLTDCDVPMPSGSEIPAHPPKSASPPKPHPKMNIVPTPAVDAPAPAPAPSSGTAAYSTSASVVLLVCLPSFLLLH